MDGEEEGADKGCLTKWNDFLLHLFFKSHLWDIFVHTLTQKISFSSNEKTDLDKIREEKHTISYLYLHVLY